MIGINVNEIDPQHTFIISGASYAGNPKPNTVMYVTKKVQHLFLGGSGCLRPEADCMTGEPDQV